MSDENLVNKLTERQKECLRLVAQLMNSKKIARELGISSHTVDDRIRRSLATLQVSDRSEAAKLLMIHENGGDGFSTPQSLIHQQSRVHSNHQNSDYVSSAGEMDPPAAGENFELREEQSFNYSDVFHTPAQASPLSVLFRVTQENKLSVTARLIAIPVIFLVTLMAVAGVASLAEGFSRIF